MGAVIDGMPAGILWDEQILFNEIQRRRPGTSAVVSSRNELDTPEVLSGVYQGKTLGTPIAILIRNQDARSNDYKQITSQPRPGHGDDVWFTKFGHSDPRGGGRSSGRETIARVVGGAVARMFLKEVCPQLKIIGFASQIGPFFLSSHALSTLSVTDLYQADRFVARYPSPAQEKDVENLLLEAKAHGLSYGGLAEIWIEGVPKNLGQPVFRKLKADFASAFMGVGAVTTFELGDGVQNVKEEGSQFHRREDDGSRYGGIRGGISTGERIRLRAGFKPTSSVLDVAKKGRHDPCIVPRAIPVLEAMAALVLVDHILWARGDRFV
ncbi:MAG: chorismate synthase [Bdellovibrionales bacterium]|nr:chorismate synthase [Bdellovibrionales bacterium]